jgi:hypothetical protein
MWMVVSSIGSNASLFGSNKPKKVCFEMQMWSQKNNNSLTLAEVHTPGVEKP